MVYHPGRQELGWKISLANLTWLFGTLENGMLMVEFSQIVIFNYSERNIKIDGVSYFDEFLESDDLNNQFEIIKRQKKMTPDDICCYVYTSGTTGNPKGVMLSHDNLIFEAKMMIRQYPNFESMGNRNRKFEFLCIVASSLKS